MAAADTSACHVTISPTPDGCRIDVAGRGTARESRAVRDAALRTLKTESSAVVMIDLSGCDYLDSTFLGCLLELNRAGKSAGRFAIAAPVERRTKLLGALRLDQLIKCVDAAPPPCGERIELQFGGDAAHKDEVARHVMECHRRLAELDSPMRGVFAHIADQLERELGTSAGAAAGK
jgi:anti-anti-sigma regulatory factor